MFRSKAKPKKYFKHNLRTRSQILKVLELPVSRESFADIHYNRTLTMQLDRLFYYEKTVRPSPTGETEVTDTDVWYEIKAKQGQFRMLQKKIQESKTVEEVRSHWRTLNKSELVAYVCMTIIDMGEKLAPVFEFPSYTMDKVYKANALIYFFRYMKVTRKMKYVTDVIAPAGELEDLPSHTTNVLSNDATEYPANFEFPDELPKRGNMLSEKYMPILRSRQRHLMGELQSFAHQKGNPKNPEYSNLVVHSLPDVDMDTSQEVTVDTHWFDLQAELSAEFANEDFTTLEYNKACRVLGLDPKRPVFPGMKEGIILTPLQVTSIWWVVDRIESGTMAGSLIAEFCGAGKTGIAIVLLLYLLQKDEQARRNSANGGLTRASNLFLIAVPRPVAIQFSDELEKWAPGLKFHRYFKTNVDQPDLLRSDFEDEGKYDPRGATNCRVFVTTFTHWYSRHPAPWIYDKDLKEFVSQEVREETYLHGIFNYLFIDEADMLKKGLYGAWSSSFIALNCDFKVGFTATPFPNKIGDMVGVLQLLTTSMVSQEVPEPIRELDEDDSWDTLEDHLVCTDFAYQRYVVDAHAELLQHNQKQEIIQRMRKILGRIMLRRLRKCTIPQAGLVYQDWPTTNPDGVVGQSIPDSITICIPVLHTKADLAEAEQLCIEPRSKLFKGGDEFGGWQNGRSFKQLVILSSWPALSRYNVENLSKRFKEAKLELDDLSGAIVIDPQDLDADFEMDGDESELDSESVVTDVTEASQHSEHSEGSEEIESEDEDRIISSADHMNLDVDEEKVEELRAKMFLDLKSTHISALRLVKEWGPKDLIPCMLRHGEVLPKTLKDALCWYHETHPKLAVLLKIINKHILEKDDSWIKDPKTFEKIVVNIEMLPVALALESYLRGFGFKVAVFHSGLNDIERRDILDRLNDTTDLSIEILLISSKMAGFGINLHHGSWILVLWDPLTNESMGIQVKGRQCRIGVKSTPIVYVVFTVGTFEHSVHIRNWLKFEPGMMALRRTDDNKRKLRAASMQDIQCLHSGYIMGTGYDTELWDKAVGYLSSPMIKQEPMKPIPKPTF